MGVVAKDLTGKTFGELTVLYRKQSVFGGGGDTRWVCLCSCGKTTEVLNGNLKNGHTKSCGHLGSSGLSQRSQDRAFRDDTAGFNIVVGAYRKRARTHDMDCTLTEVDFRRLFSAPCFYCGLDPQQVSKARSRLGADFVYNGIDRLDSSKGYAPENCVTCCKQCNYAKGTQSPEEFLAWARRIAEFQGG